MNDQELEEPEDAVTVRAAAVEIQSSRRHSRGTNDYKNRYLDIVANMDRGGTHYEPRWADEPLELFDGVETFTKDHQRCVRIQRSSCPVRVRFREFFEYVSCDPWEHNSSSTRHGWGRCEADEGAGGVEVEG